jgi:Sad1 / UNC-like C-terminal
MWVAYVVLILASWSSIALSDGVGSATSIPPTEQIQNVATTGSPDRSDTLNRAEQVLLQYNKWTKESPLPVDSSLPSSLSSMQRLRELEQTYENLIHKINTQQLKKLQATLDAYFAQISNASPELYKNETNVSLEQLERTYLSSLSARTKELIKEAVADSELQAILTALSDRGKALVQSNGKAPGTCLLTKEAALAVHDALMRYARDGIGQIDRAGYIVHQYTSPTHVVKDDAAFSNLGNVWWRRYIPQDWEALLPVGWQSWKNGFALPDHMYHTFGRSGASTAPPKAVLEATTLPGHCWPVSMQSGGPPILTIGLTEPIAVSAISIDHVSRLLLEHPEEQMKSAPKRLKIFGYPPCDACHALGFDLSLKFLLTEIFYDIESSQSVQTFSATEEVATSNTESPPSRDSADAASCSAVTESCSGDVRAPLIASAVSVEVAENWGNEEYTCLYRVRIHGEPIR